MMSEGRDLVFLQALAAQDVANGPEWRKKQHHWDYATVNACAMAIREIGPWYWFSETPPADTSKYVRNLHLSLVQILELGLSMEMDGSRIEDTTHEIYRRSAGLFCRLFDSSLDEDLPRAVKSVQMLGRHVSETGTFLFPKFTDACMYSGLHYDGLMTLYFGKMALLKFRESKAKEKGDYEQSWLIQGYPPRLVHDVDAMAQMVFSFLDGGETIRTVGFDEFWRHMNREFARLYQTLI